MQARSKVFTDTLLIKKSGQALMFPIKAWKTLYICFICSIRPKQVVRYFLKSPNSNAHIQAVTEPSGVGTLNLKSTNCRWTKKLSRKITSKAIAKFWVKNIAKRTTCSLIFCINAGSNLRDSLHRTPKTDSTNLIETALAEVHNCFNVSNLTVWVSKVLVKEFFYI